MDKDKNKLLFHIGTDIKRLLHVKLIEIHRTKNKNGTTVGIHTSCVGKTWMLCTHCVPGQDGGVDWG